MKLKIKLIILAVLIALFAGLGITVGIMAKENKRWKEKYELVQQTNTSYLRDLESAKNDIHMYELTMNDLYMMKDSLTTSLLDLKAQLKLKDKQVQNLQYMYTHFVKHDTLTFEDTIFIEPEFCLDTLLGDKWIMNDLHLEYPNTIDIATQVNSKKKVVVYLVKETVNPPKKTWIGRLFQKKRKVAKVYIDEENPYIEDQQNLFIDVVKR